MGLAETIYLMSAQNISVSVIVPVFNSSTTILRALDSIFIQTTQPQEIIIVDDASTDDSCAVIEKYIEDRPTIKLLRFAANRGPSAARNAGWSVASGDYVAFLDADDAWHRKKLETQFLFMQDNPEFAITGHQYRVVTDSESDETNLNSEFDVSIFSFRDFLVKNRFSTPTVMIHKSVDERFDEQQRFSEDYLLWLRIIARCKRGAFIKQPMAYLFKPTYGAGGISGRMFEMYRGELANARVLRQQKLISMITELTLRVWLTIKFAVRLTQRPSRKSSNQP